ncbi:phosphatidylethanolamine-binding protein [Leptodontidium sp. 2 PMI_412]|nr:phosphatidylethanolamine-binding protein [Leptodontidium sp. 2 PMI_412]
MSLDTYSQQLVSTLSKVGLAPGSIPLIPGTFKLSTILGIKFGERAVTYGEIFRVSECKVAPTISFAPEVGKDASTSYTLLLVDPDAPTPEEPKFAFWRHWVVAGLQPSQAPPGSVAVEQAVASKSPLTEYLGPGPKDDSTPHRYLFLLFRAPAGLSLSKSDVGGEEFVDRRSFKAAEWVAKHGLELVSVNWMLGAGDGWSGIAPGQVKEL